ncbi:putative NAD(P)H-dependent FMN reductase LOT6 [Astrocystis sublimbata]|nr:putative NAD(P)H-dependent FMN reductase LOT6 [Astrocystis sublimbata]
MAKIAIIIGSTREPRVGSSIASWVEDIIKSEASSGVEVEPLSIADFNLPVFDEPVMPATVSDTNPLQKEHSKKWSAAISSFQGYVFVIPEYNGTMSGGTKNAVDYLYHEIPGKPVAVVSYGIQGGSRANEHLAWSLENVLKMKVAATRVTLPFAPADIGSSVSGTLGDETKKQWTEAGKKEEIVKAFGEVKAGLN